MSFALNYSHCAAKLLRAGEIQVALFKCPEWPDLIAEVLKLCPCYPHFAFLAGRGQVQKADWGLVHRLTDLTRSPHFNLHLGPRVTDFPGLTLDSTDPRDRDRLVEAMTRDVLFAQREFPPERIALENLMWDPLPPWQIPRWALRPEVVREVIERTGCRLLLDLSHAGVTARMLGMTAEEYILSLPLERLCEMHLSGTRLCEDGLWRDHHPMGEHDWRLAEWAFGHIARGEWPAPDIIAFEYGGIGPGFEERTDERMLREQVPQLARRLQELRLF
jgi:uncharacterized protein (UPF0276 family)